MRVKKLLANFFVGVICIGFTSNLLAQAPGDRIPDRFIVELAPGVDAGSVADFHGVVPVHVYEHAINGFAGFVPPGRINALRNDPLVVSVAPDRIVTANPKGGNGGKKGGGGTQPPATQTVPSGVARIGASPGSLNPNFTGNGIGVAILDTGVDSGHADLRVATDNFSAFGSTGQDDHGHGTHVSGIVAAVNNDLDVVGVAPDATIYAVKILNSSGSGSDSTIIAGLDWVMSHYNITSPPIRVVNMSLGRPGTLSDSPALRSAIQNIHGAGITVVVSAGNGCDKEVSEMVPATYPEVIAVASTTARAGNNKCRFLDNPIDQDTASYFSTDGAFDDQTKIGVSISAPGEANEDVNRGCMIKSVGILSTQLGGGTTRMSGTSMSAPHVAGVAALLYQQAGGTLSPEAVQNAIRSGADRLGESPQANPSSCYSFDGVKEGILSAPGALSVYPNP